MAANPGRYNITVYTGTTFSLASVWKINGNAVDLTGYSADMQVRAATDTSIIIELSTSNSRVVITPNLGQTTLNLTATETAALAPGIYVYDLNLTASNGDVNKILAGNFVVIASVTQ